jgi:nitrite reductase/ring-hydroxylating ferredoxin subunit
VDVRQNYDGVESEPMHIKFLKRNIFQRILGLPMTSKPVHPDCWQYSEAKLTIDLTKTPELKNNGGAIRLEGNNLPLRILVIAGDDGQYHAFHNRCSHLGHRRLDPVPETVTVQCCSVNKSTYDLNGKIIYGPAPNPIKVFSVSRDGERLSIMIN